jgi:hypothetical protein
MSCCALLFLQPEFKDKVILLHALNGALALEGGEWSASCPEPEFNESNNIINQSLNHVAF